MQVLRHDARRAGDRGLLLGAGVGCWCAAGALLALAAVPNLVVPVSLLILKTPTLRIEDGAVGVAILLILLGDLLRQLVLIKVDQVLSPG